MEKSQLKISNLIQRNIKAWRGKATRGAAGRGLARQGKAKGISMNFKPIKCCGRIMSTAIDPKIGLVLCCYICKKHESIKIQTKGGSYGKKGR
jgi:hypothetical protein